MSITWVGIYLIILRYKVEDMNSSLNSHYSHQHIHRKIYNWSNDWKEEFKNEKKEKHTLSSNLLINISNKLTFSIRKKKKSHSSPDPILETGLLNLIHLKKMIVCHFINNTFEFEIIKW